MIETGGDVRAFQPVVAFGRSPPPLGDERREPTVTLSILRQEDEPRSVEELRLGANDKLEAAVLGRAMGPHHTGKRTLVGQRKRRVAESLGFCQQLLGVGGASQEGEVREAVKLGVAGQIRHGR